MKREMKLDEKRKLGKNDSLEEPTFDLQTISIDLASLPDPSAAFQLLVSSRLPDHLSLQRVYSSNLLFLPFFSPSLRNRDVELTNLPPLVHSSLILELPSKFSCSVL
jgi:hypothetical protein